MLAKTAKFGESGYFSKILPVAKVVGEVIRTNKLTQLEGPWNVGENGEFVESGDFSEISPRLSTKW